MSLLEEQIGEVAKRFRSLDLWRSISIIIGFLAIAGVAMLLMQISGMYVHPLSGWALLLAGAAGMAVSGITAYCAHRDQRVIAHKIEEEFPELDHRLLTTLDEVERNEGKPLGFLQHAVFQETIAHSYHNPWWNTVSPKLLSAFRSRGLAAICMVMACGVGLMNISPPAEALVSDKDKKQDFSPDSANFEIQVEPGNGEIERGSNLIVIARFGKHTPKEAFLVASSDGDEMRLPMSRSLDDPLFGVTVSDVQDPVDYHVVYGSHKSESYRVTVFTYPELIRADAMLEMPRYTGLADKRIEDTRRVSVVEGTRVTWNLHVNKPGVSVELIPESQTEEVIPLLLDTTDPLNHLVSLDLARTTSWKVKLVDADGRENRVKPTLKATVTPNRPPNLKLELARDASVSPLEEFLVKATVSDDYGLQRYGLNYTLASASPQDIILGEEAKRREKKSAAHMLDFEAMAAEPDQLLSYYFWAEDSDAQGNVRRTLSDMFFAEVRHFEEIFRQGEQQPGGQQQQQQQQQGQQQSQNAADAEQLAELQKQIINATWGLIRREVAVSVSPEYAEDVSVIVESQQAASAQLQELAQELEDRESQQFAMDVQSHMQESLRELMTAFSDVDVEALTPAMQAQRNAYQALLKLRAREHEVVQQQQGQQQQQQQQQSASRQRFQQQLQQLELQNDQNRYEQEQQAQEEEDEAETEMRQALSRLRELAQRQKDLNQQLQELQNALEQAESEAEREEIERQLKRLRDQQQELLRDVDELTERLEESSDQEALQQTQEQLQETREQLRESAESLEKGEVTPALASGTRAQQQLEEMKEELRRESANQFEEQMRDMRERARELESRQQEIGEQMDQQAESEERGRGLRDEETGVEEDLGDALREQNQKLNELMQEIEGTVREAEESEPLLAENLYEAFRDIERDQVQEQLDRAAELSDRGLANPAQQLESQARESITNFRETIDRAAESVLGDELDSLRTAERMLQNLERQLDSEINQFNPPEPGRGDPTQNPDGEPSEPQGERQPGEDQQSRQEGDQNREGDPSERERQERQPGERQPGEGQGEPSEQQPQDQPPNSGQGQPPEQQDSEQSGQPGEQQNQPPNENEEPSESQQPNESQQPGESPGQGGGGGQQPQDSEDQEPRNGEPQDPQRQARDRQAVSQSLRQGGNRQQRQDGGGLAGWEQLDVAPITGEDFREWSDGLRDVEEIVDDPELRAEAARIRERARGFRGEFKRHSEEPRWDLIKKMVSDPLRELRQEVTAELLRRSAEKNALVPIDRDPVPEQFTEQVRRYYENLGKGE